MSGFAAMLDRAAAGRAPSAEAALALADCDDLAALMEVAAALRDRGHGANVSYSRKVFIPLTRLCRDSCHYCTFARPPRRGEAAYLAPEEVLAIAQAGANADCKEALFTLGDRPELRYRAAREELARLGHGSTISYLAASAALVLRETGLLPHVNPGVMSAAEIARLRAVSVSQGLMLESAAERLTRRGGPHFGSPDKAPAARLASIAAAGAAAVPFTSGILIGIGERRRERIEALLHLRTLHRRYGHLQEIIIQNFRAKPGTRMAQHSEPTLADHLWTVAVARILFGADMSIQAPPNLQAGALERLIAAGINDWGGVSPVTPDHVNPERPWPELDALARATAAAGKVLLERLAVYPRFVEEKERWIAPALQGHVWRMADAEGFARTEAWAPGAQVPPPPPMPATGPLLLDRAANSVGSPPPCGEGLGVGVLRRGDGVPNLTTPLPTPPPAEVGYIRLRPPKMPNSGKPEFGWGREQTELSARVNSNSPQHALAPIIERALRGAELGEADIVALFAARGESFREVCAAADALRAESCGERVSYVVTRNINYTNVCAYRCAFCAFSKGRTSLRGRPYDLTLEEIARRGREAWARGAVEACLQGGIHPDYGGETYLAICRAIKAAVPGLHVHAFSPLEIFHGAATLEISVAEFLSALKAAGLGSLPGTAAEILDDEVRKIICPDKVTTAQWLDVVATAHRAGLRTTATIMFGHVDSPRHWARHLLRVRRLQAETGGFTELVPLPFVPMKAPIKLRGQSRLGPTFREAVLMHAVARLALHPLIANIQTSWVKMGPQGAAACLKAGANDLGGTLMNESITRAAGARHGQEMAPEAMERLIRSLGRQPWQRTTLYGVAPAERVAASFDAPPLSPPVDTPARRSAPRHHPIHDVK